MSSSFPEVVLVLTTIAVEADGSVLARTLVDERLAACVNVLPPMTSVYRWKGQVEQDREQQVIIKTTRDKLPALDDAAARPGSRQRVRRLSEVGW